MRQLLLGLVLVLLASFSTHATSTSLSLTNTHNTSLSKKVATRIARLDLPLEATSTNRHLRHKLKDLLSGGPSTERMLGRAEAYFPLVEKALCERGLPEELKYLAVVESMLQVKAGSHAGAAGLWQFMPHTARHYGLRVDYLIDERYDVEKSTEAAGEFLADLYAYFGDWHLVAAAYNAGPVRVRRAIRAAGNVWSYTAIERYLPRETRNYVSTYVAVAYTLNYHQKHGLEARPQDAMMVGTTTLYKRTSLRTLSEATGLKYRTLRNLNPAVLTGVVPATREGITLRYPLAQQIAVLTQLWGQPTLVETDELLQLDVAIEEAAESGFAAQEWLLGAGQLANNYAQSISYRTAAGHLASEWLANQPVFASL